MSSTNSRTPHLSNRKKQEKIRRARVRKARAKALSRQQQELRPLADETFANRSAKQPGCALPGAGIHLVLVAANGGVLLEDSVPTGLQEDLPGQLHDALTLLETRYLPAQHKRTEGHFLAKVFGDAPVPGPAADGEQTPLQLMLASLREALINALGHGEGNSGPISVLVREDRIEVRNPCHLPEGVNARKLLPAGVSLPGSGNALDIFVQAGLAQGKGNGLKTLRACWKQLGYPVPRICLQRAQADPADPADEPGQQPDCDTFTLRFACVPPTVSDRPRRARPATRANALRLHGLLLENPGLSIRRMAELTGLGISQVRNALRCLREHGLLARVGNNRSGSWQVLGPALPDEMTQAAAPCATREADSPIPTCGETSGSADSEAADAGSAAEASPEPKALAGPQGSAGGKVSADSQAAPGTPARALPSAADPKLQAS